MVCVGVLAATDIHDVVLALAPGMVEVLDDRVGGERVRAARSGRLGELDIAALVPVARVVEEASVGSSAVP